MLNEHFAAVTAHASAPSLRNFVCRVQNHQITPARVIGLSCLTALCLCGFYFAFAHFMAIIFYRCNLFFIIFRQHRWKTSYILYGISGKFGQ